MYIPLFLKNEYFFHKFTWNISLYHNQILPFVIIILHFIQKLLFSHFKNQPTYIRPFEFTMHVIYEDDTAAFENKFIVLHICLVVVSRIIYTFWPNSHNLFRALGNKILGFSPLILMYLWDMKIFLIFHLHYTQSCCNPFSPSQW